MSLIPVVAAKEKNHVQDKPLVIVFPSLKVCQVASGHNESSSDSPKPTAQNVDSQWIIIFVAALDH